MMHQEGNIENFSTLLSEQYHSLLSFCMRAQRRRRRRVSEDRIKKQYKVRLNVYISGTSVSQKRSAASRGCHYTYTVRHRAEEIEEQNVSSALRSTDCRPRRSAQHTVHASWRKSIRKNFLSSLSLAFFFALDTIKDAHFVPFPGLIHFVCISPRWCMRLRNGKRAA